MEGNIGDERERERENERMRVGNKSNEGEEGEEEWLGHKRYITFKYKKKKMPRLHYKFCLNYPKTSEFQKSY